MKSVNLSDDSDETQRPLYRALTEGVWFDIDAEWRRSLQMHPIHPDDPLRFTGIMLEEAGEAFGAAMDLTRLPLGVGTENQPRELELTLDLYRETCECATSAIRNMLKMKPIIKELIRNVRPTQQP